MCRYADRDYRDHYICLDCQKGFKGVAVCPACRQFMKRMGKDFRIPSAHDDKQWAKVRLLVANGFTFYSCGCTGPGYGPKTIQAARRFIERRKIARMGEAGRLLENSKRRAEKGRRVKLLTYRECNQLW